MEKNPFTPIRPSNDQSCHEIRPTGEIGYGLLQEVEVPQENSIGRHLPTRTTGGLAGDRGVIEMNPEFAILVADARVDEPRLQSWRAL